MFVTEERAAKKNDFFLGWAEGVAPNSHRSRPAGRRTPSANLRRIAIRDVAHRTEELVRDPVDRIFAPCAGRGPRARAGRPPCHARTSPHQEETRTAACRSRRARSRHAETRLASNIQHRLDRHRLVARAGQGDALSPGFHFRPATLALARARAEATAGIKTPPGRRRERSRGIGLRPQFDYVLSKRSIASVGWHGYRKPLFRTILATALAYTSMPKADG